jgi:hypothetical protein
MKNLLLIIAAGLAIANCRPPAPKPEITKKPTDGDHQLNPQNPAPLKAQYVVVEKEQTLTDNKSVKGDLHKEEFPMKTESHFIDVSFQVQTPTYTVNYVYGQTNKSHKNDDGSVVKCVDVRKFRLFCSSITGLPAPYPKSFKVSKDYIKIFVKRADMQTEKEVTTFDFNASTNIVEIPSADLAYNANVRIEFRTADTKLYNQRYIVPSTLKVKVNNTEEHDFTYEPSTNILTINYPVPNNAKISLKYEARYPLRTIQVNEDANNIKVVNEAGKELDFTKQAQSIQILEKDFEVGKSLTVTYTSKNSDIPLNHLPISGTLAASSNISGCSLGSGIELVGQALKISCPGAADQEVVVTYTYRYLAIKRDFVLAVEKPEAGTWKVFINGQLTTNFKRDYTTITVEAPLKQGDQVELAFERDS